MHLLYLIEKDHTPMMGYAAVSNVTMRIGNDVGHPKRYMAQVEQEKPCQV